MPEAQMLDAHILDVQTLDVQMPDAHMLDAQMPDARMLDAHMLAVRMLDVQMRAVPDHHYSIDDELCTLILKVIQCKINRGQCPIVLETFSRNESCQNDSP